LRRTFLLLKSRKKGINVLANNGKDTAIEETDGIDRRKKLGK